MSKRITISINPTIIEVMIGKTKNVSERIETLILLGYEAERQKLISQRKPSEVLVEAEMEYPLHLIWSQVHQRHSAIIPGGT